MEKHEIEMQTAKAPQKVRTACTLLAVMLVIGVIGATINYAFSITIAPIGMVLIVQAIVITLTGLNIYFILVGKNWARILYAVMFITGLPGSIKPTLIYIQTSPLVGILTIIQIAIQIIAIVNLFSSESNQWFKKNGNQKDKKVEKSS